MKIWLPCVPSTVTKQSGFRFTKGGKKYKTDRLEEYELTLKGLLAAYAPSEPIVGPVKVEVTIVFPFTKDDQKTKAKRAELVEYGAMWEMSKPDVDNAAKVVLDCMAGLFFEDDKSVVCLVAKKMRAVATGICVSVEPLPKWPGLAASLGEESL